MTTTVTITEVTKRGWMYRVEFSDARIVWVSVAKNADGAWDATPLLRCASGSVPLADIARTARTRRDAIALAATAYHDGATS